MVMPFRLTNALATFQELINNVLRPYLDIFVIAYLDDILVYLKNEEQHTKHVRKVLTALDAYSLRLKPQKCEFHKTKVNFLGYVVGINGVQISEEKIEVIKNQPTPKTVKDVQSFLGFVNFNRMFIKDFSKIANPLTQLTRKDTQQDQTKEAEEAFQTLKAACITPPYFKIFKSGKLLRFETDALDLALGGCASQLHDGKWHLIAYYLRKFLGLEERYDVHNKELLAIIACIQHQRVYAHSCLELTIYTDYKNLTFFTITKILNKRQTRQAELLRQYKFKIVYTLGKENGKADALSRRHDIAGTKTIIKQLILKINKDGTISLAHEINILMKIRKDVPKEAQQTIIQKHHDNLVHGHLEIARTIELIQRNY